jgi:hypothetical protein
LYTPLLSKGNIRYVFLVTPISCPKILHEFQWNLALIAQKCIVSVHCLVYAGPMQQCSTANASRTAVISWVVRTHNVLFNMQHLWAILGYTNNNINDCNVVITFAEVDFCLQWTARPVHASQFAVLLLWNLTTFKTCVCVR